MTFPQSTFAARHYFGMYIVGNSKAITCTISSATRIEWLHNGSVVQSGAGPRQTLRLSVNDSIHHNLYTCRGYRNFTIIESNNFTMIVNGMCNHQFNSVQYTLLSPFYVHNCCFYNILYLDCLLCMCSAKYCNLHLHNCCVYSQFGPEPQHSLYSH